MNRRLEPYLSGCRSNQAVGALEEQMGWQRIRLEADALFQTHVYGIPRRRYVGRWTHAGSAESKANSSSQSFICRPCDGRAPAPWETLVVVQP